MAKKKEEEFVPEWQSAEKMKELTGMFRELCNFAVGLGFEQVIRDEEDPELKKQHKDVQKKLTDQCFKLYAEPTLSKLAETSTEELK